MMNTKTNLSGVPPPFLTLTHSQVGSSNRMTRFLSGLAPTGDMETAQTSEAVVLSAAMANLRRCAFIGLLERCGVFARSVA